MISIIITAFKEEKTIKKSIRAIAEQDIGKNEILVVAPDKETLDAAREIKKKHKQVRTIKDPGNGKPAALNIAVSKARGDILVLTDGDVYVGEDSLPTLIKPFDDKEIGAVSGHPISTNPKNNKYGFWSYLLTRIAHERRVKAGWMEKRFFCSGYLFAIRKKLFPKLPVNLLSEDGYISHKVYEKGHKIGYSDRSKVYVKYPTNLRDWINQKKRSAGGYKQLKEEVGVEIRSLKKESSGSLGFLKYISGINEFIWLMELFLARLYLWYRIYADVDLSKKSYKDIWVRIESTK